MDEGSEAGEVDEEEEPKKDILLSSCVDWIEVLNDLRVV